MFNFFSKLTKYLDNVTIFVMGTVEWHTVVLMFLIAFEVIMRYLFNAPTLWGLDVQTYISAGGRVIGFGYASLVHSHITMDIFTARMSFGKSKALELISYVIFQLPLLFALVWATLTRGLESLRIHELYYSVWKPPLAPIILFIDGAYVLMTMQIVSEIIKDSISLKKGSDAWLKQR